MIREYLEQEKIQNYERRVSLIKKQNLIQNKLRDNQRMIDLLENNEDVNIESFSPREKNHFSKEKLNELKDNKGKMESELSNLEKELSEQKEMESMINSIGKECDGLLKRLDVLDEINLKEIRNVIVDFKIDLEQLEHKIRFCEEISNMDAGRCKLELKSSLVLLDKISENFLKIFVLDNVLEKLDSVEYRQVKTSDSKEVI